LSAARAAGTCGSATAWKSKVGRNDPQLRLQRFARDAAAPAQRDPRVLVRADLRYTNGFALTWQAAKPVPRTTTPLATQANT
jgi:cell division protein FtsQ